MCRLAYIPSGIKDKKFLYTLFQNLENEAGGDGNGIGGFIDKKPFIYKNIERGIETFVNEAVDKTWDNGFLFHTRKASMGVVNNNNCHPFNWENTITIHNGTVEGAAILKLMMYENIEKYGLIREKIMTTPDSDIMAYFIWKYGFEIASMFESGTVITMYPDHISIYNGRDLEAIKIKNMWIFASEFSDTMGSTADEWVLFSKKSLIQIKYSDIKILSGYCIDKKKLYIILNKKIEVL